MGRLAVIAGSSLRGAPLPPGDWEMIQRHGEAAGYVLPHRVDHVANLRALAGAGCDRVLAIASVGSLRREFGPGTLLCPDDFIGLDAEPVTALEGADAHRVPGFDPGWRDRVLAAFGAAGADAHDGGTYWQTSGPRLETAAEVRLLAAHAHVVGMTVASECVVAGELGLAYAAICVVDNFANGVGDAPLTLGDVEAWRAAHRKKLIGVIAAVLPALSEP